MFAKLSSLEIPSNVNFSKFPTKCFIATRMHGVLGMQQHKKVTLSEISLVKA